MAQDDARTRLARGARRARSAGGLARGVLATGLALSCWVFGWVAPIGASAADSAAGRDRASTPGLNAAAWATMLEAHTRSVDDLAGTRVDYVALGRDPAWRRFVDGLAEAEPPRSHAGRMAFWIDVYNALAIDTVVRGWPVESIRDVGSFFRPVWGRDAGRVAGRTVTLHEIEHEILRPMGDPRIHMAIVCASLSCPSLSRRPFSAEVPATGGDPGAGLDARLDAAVRRFLGDERKGLAIDRDAGTLTLSRIFDWFDEDFDAVGGVRAFVVAHMGQVESMSGEDRHWLASSRSKIDLRYFDYDWAVNAVAD